MTSEHPPEKLVDRVRKLLSLAGNENAEERESALLMAQRMMADHGLSHEDVQASSRKVGHAGITNSDGPPPRWIQMLASTVALNFRCFSFVVEERSRDGEPQVHKQIMLGLSEDVEIATYVFRSAVSAAKDAAAEYLEKGGAQDGWMIAAVDIGTTSSSTFGYGAQMFRMKSVDLKRSAGLRNDFLLGWVVGLCHKFAKQVQSFENALVVSRPPEVEKVIRKMEMQPAEVRDEEFAGSWAAQNAGARAGLDFDYARPIEGDDSVVRARLLPGPDDDKE